VSDRAGLTNLHVQQTLLGEAIASGSVGFLVWDDNRRYVAANAAACALLGCSLEQIIGATVGARTEGGAEVIAHVIRQDRSHGRLTVERFDGSGPIEVEYVTFATSTAGLPYMASLIWPAVDDQAAEA
jgi:PAS domain-containing protein